MTHSPEHARLAAAYERHRADLTSFVTRMVIRRAIADELVQETALRLLTTDARLTDDDDIRAWLFRVAANLSIDHLRRHGTQREVVLLDVRDRAESNGDFVQWSQGLRGSPETQAIAREHLAVCFACTLRNLPAQHAAALLLKEVYGFSNQEVADVLEVRFAQAKHWVQSARERLDEIYSTTCALVSQAGVCHQCVELDQYFNGQARDPLAGTARRLEARLQLLREMRDRPPGRWHSALFELVRDLVG